MGLLIWWLGGLFLTICALGCVYWYADKMGDKDNDPKTSQVAQRS